LSTLEQSRYLATAIPGPRSLELIDRKSAAVSRGVGTTMPVYAARAFGGIVEDVDGNRLIDLGSGIAVTTIRDRNLVFGSRSRTSPFRFGFGAETDFRPALSEFAESPSGCQRRFGLLSLVRARFGLPGGRAGRQEARTGRLRRLFGRSEGLGDKVFLFHGGKSL
jgi:hypothetical protein